MSDGDLKQYFLSLGKARSLKGKTLDRIEREGDGVRIWFTDGTALSITGDRPQYGRLMVYYLTGETRPSA